MPMRSAECVASLRGRKLSRSCSSVSMCTATSTSRASRLAGCMPLQRSPPECVAWPSSPSTCPTHLEAEIQADISAATKATKMLLELPYLGDVLAWVLARVDSYSRMSAAPDMRRALEKMARSPDDTGARASRGHGPVLGALLPWLHRQHAHPQCSVGLQFDCSWEHQGPGGDHQRPGRHHKPAADAAVGSSSDPWLGTSCSTSGMGPPALP
jgi:hypothetical protein